MRCAITLSYNGTHFLGSQAQKSSTNTIVGTLETILLKLGIDSKIVASGRTDKGVHATAQVCHLDLPLYWQDLKKLKRALNSMLPSSILIKNLKEVDYAFHARYSAKKRVYRYIIKVANGNPFEANFVTFVDSIDFKKIENNIELFKGRHDFANFMKMGSDTKSSIREIYKAFAYRHKDFIVLHFEANGFLRSQIRLMVAALLKIEEQEIKESLSCKKKHKLKPAPSNGLYLAKVKY
ncbi:MAG: tRNA pseudouridine(38-40) synthase TruA [Sulfurimonas sp.]|uniref:tRNA pseudouridine(38-40) synthase TruA n=1 Tax=Sulfurimonas sp. TaxID=2022749 RepID=UPI0025EDC248|nr:tRNA pseudouridine(38-40) synthase TruA [Sulfurimonas sp.]MCK9492124.1 tRNA pseudouridine(38-40) synthase TruA [Sulfurimonas sp.]